MHVLQLTRTFMRECAGPLTIQQIAEHFGVGYNRAAEITRYGTRHGYFTRGWRYGKSVYSPANLFNADRGRTRFYSEKNVSFGIEAEFDVLRMEPEGITALGDLDPEWNFQHRAVGWQPHGDSTVAAEIVSPPFTDIGLAMNSTRTVWEKWLEFNATDDGETRHAPYMVGNNTNSGGNDSIGTHIHIGYSSGSMPRHEKLKVAEYALSEYPTVIALTANSPNGDWLSGRLARCGTRSGFARRIENVAMGRPSSGCGDDNHYLEISDSHHGTVEFRAQDSTCPQAILTSAWLLQKLAEKAVKLEDVPGDINWDEYTARRKSAFGETAIGVDWSNQARLGLIAKLGDLSLDDLPTSVKEMLFLLLKKRIRPGEIQRDMIAQNERLEFEYMEKTAVNPDKYLELFMEFTNANDEQKSWARNMAMEVRLAHKLSDLTPDLEIKNLPLPDTAATPRTQWFRLRRLSDGQIDAAAAMIGMSGMQMNLSPSRFFIRLNGTEVDDVWAEL
jgi:hypothetical protein